MGKGREREKETRILEFTPIIIIDQLKKNIMGHGSLVIRTDQYYLNSC